MGRPTKYTPERVKKITDALRIGATRKCAVGAAGVDFVTFLRWMQLYSSFSTAVTQAEDEAELRFTARLAKEAQAVNGDWRAAVEWLKRRRRDDWSERVDLKHLSDEDLIAETKRAFGGNLQAILSAPVADRDEGRVEA